jgi:hypothetical protein
MEFIKRSGNFLNINISKWIKFNGKESYLLYYADAPLNQSTKFKNYTMPINGIESSFITTESGKWFMYIVGKDGYMSCFIGTIDSICDLNNDFNKALNAMPKIGVNRR